MEQSTPTPRYIKTDKNVFLNEQSIRWIKKMDECFAVCMKQNGCRLNYDTHEICKYNSLSSYEMLNDLISN